MRYLDLISERPFVWGLFVIYLVGTSYLAWLGHRRTRDIKSFAVGDGNMHPWVVGLTLAASIASTATFVLNPGLVYTFGLSALLHYGLSVTAGVACALFVLSKGFRRVGARYQALTLPQWIGERFGSKGLKVFFAAASLLSITFVVLILGGVAVVMHQTLGMGRTEALVLITVFVFGYIFVGGTYAHAYTNTMQAVIMIAVSLLIVGSGMHYFSDGLGAFFDRLRAVDPQLASMTNSHTPMFDSIFKVWVAGFVIGFAVVCQPHILSKALYVRDDAAVKKYLGVAIVVTLIFTSLLIVGLYVRVGGFSQELASKEVMGVYIGETFSGPLLAFISVALVAAGMSTLDGILVALSSIAANDLFLGLTEDNVLKNFSDEAKAHLAHRASQVILVVLGIVAFVIAWAEVDNLALFGQVGVYGLVAAACTPVVIGVLFEEARVALAWVVAASVIPVLVHFAVYWGLDSVTNPAVSAVFGIAAGPCVILLQRTIWVLTGRQRVASL